MKNKIYKLTLILLVLTITILACGTSNGNGDQTQPGDEQQNGSDTEWTVEDFRSLGAYAALDSYRLTTEIIERDSEGNALTTMIVTIEADNTMDALHTVVADSEGSIFFESIVIGGTMWLKNPFGETWIQSPNTEEEEQDSELNPWGTEKWESWDEDEFEGYVTYEGKDTTNGVRCRRFYVEDESSMTQGTIWVADQSGLPKVIIRTELITTPINSGVDASSTDVLINVTDINTSITIEPPQ